MPNQKLEEKVQEYIQMIERSGWVPSVEYSADGNRASVKALDPDDNQTLVEITWIYNHLSGRVSFHHAERDAVRIVRQRQFRNASEAIRHLRKSA